jgi:tetratricopeptide (TPR) repeat protein
VSGRFQERRRVWLLRALTAIAAPALVFVLLEGLLRLAGAGHPSSFLLDARIGGREMLIENEKFGWRFFPPDIARQPVHLAVARDKDPGALRVFVLGESAAMGDPEPAFGLARMLEVLLRHALPGRRVEVINAAMTAINSHAVRLIARDCAAAGPDGFVVYMGNNEVVGPYGPGTTFHGPVGGLAFVRGSVWLRGTRLGQVLGRGLSRAGGGARSWMGLEMFLDRQVAAEDPRLLDVYRGYRRNLAAVIRAGARAGARVVVCTVASNLRSCPPFASGHRALDEAAGREWTEWRNRVEERIAARDWEGALEACRRAERLEAGDAALQFRVGECLLALGRRDEARVRFETARDLDRLRFRADGAINRIVREVAGEEAGRADVVLVDAERAFAAASEAGVPGDDYFLDHVHFNFAGAYLLARRVAEPIARARGAEALADRESCAAALAYAGWDERRLLAELLARRTTPPFTAQLDQDRRLRDLVGRIRAANGGAGEAERACDAALAANAGDAAIRVRRGRLRLAASRPAEACADFEAVLETMPQHREARWGLAESLARLGRAGEMAVLLSADRPGATSADRLDDRIQVGRNLVEGGYPERGLELLSAVLREDARNSGALVNAGAACARMGEADQARALFEQALAADRRDTEALYNLATAWRESGDLARAEERYREAVAAWPAFARARRDLGILLAAQGRRREALRELREALRFRPYDDRSLLNAAWLLAVSPEDDLRNGAEAIRFAERAMITGDDGVVPKNVRAVSHAEAGDFPRALDLAREALAGARAEGGGALEQLIAGEIACFEKGRPYRESAAGGPDTSGR